jgi:hypothetical protein
LGQNTPICIGRTLEVKFERRPPRNVIGAAFPATGAGVSNSSPVPYTFTHGLAFEQRFRPFGLVRFFIQSALLEQRGLPLRTLSVAVRPRGLTLSVSVFGVERRLALVAIALFQLFAIKCLDLLVVGRNGLELLPRGRKNFFVHERRFELF